MPYVITDPCKSCKDNACVTACPVNAIHPTPGEADYTGSDQLYIDPIACIDCGACVPECPVEAIFRHDEVPPQWADAINLNKAYYTPLKKAS